MFNLIRITHVFDPQLENRETVHYTASSPPPLQLPAASMPTSTSRNADALRACLGHPPTEQEANSIARIGYQIALIRLRQLIASGKLHLTSFHIPLEGMAFDCIAELMERDPAGRFPELEDYFAGCLDWRNLQDDQLEDHLRALVFTKVADGIFRLYRENDPILARIIRNLKSAVRSDSGIRQLDRLALTYVFTCDPSELNEHYPEYPLDQLECEAAGSVNEKSSAREFLHAILCILNSQDEFRRFYSLMDLALLAKRLRLRRHTALRTDFEIDDALLEADAKATIEKSFADVSQRLRKRYVDSGKIAPEVFRNYAMALREMVLDTFLQNDGGLLSHPQYLQLFMPDLTQEEYRQSHRTHFEYMAKLSKNMVKRDLRELFQ
jgi:hypothetical protein